MIIPTIGRVVLVHRPDKSLSNQPEPALICYVWNNESVNVAGFDNNGNPFKELNLHLEGGDETKLDQNLPYAFWMPYQKQMAGRGA